MGSGSWSSSAWSSHASTVSSKPTASIFVKRSIDDYLNPKGIKFRESCDSDEHPNSCPIIVALDVTGSMGEIAGMIARKGLGIVFNEILDRKPVEDPQLMFMAVGDVLCDDAPLQVSQFESDNKIIEQLEKIYIEHGGGGNNSESYDLPWYFAAKHTKIDSWTKRHKKGYIFTIGDEMFPEEVSKDNLDKFIGDTVQSEVKSVDSLKMAEQMYHVFHIIIAEGNGVESMGLDTVKESWQKHLGQRAMVLDDANKLSELIVSTIQITEGADKAKVIASWDGSTSLSIAKAVSDLSPAVSVASSGGVVTL